MIKPGVSINMTLLFRDPENAKELGEVLWAATKEVENFFDFGDRRVGFFRTFLSEFIPYTIRQSSTAFARALLPANMKLFEPGVEKPHGTETPTFSVDLSQSNSVWKKAEGKYTLTYETQKVLQIVNELIGGETSGPTPVVVTDLLLTPPPDWRYIISDGGSDGVIISIPPTDPKFWRINDRLRMAIIKHRVRTALLSSVGEIIGLQECDNERCFLFRDVDSVTRLDGMMLLGPEHDLAALSQRGFELPLDDPANVQPIVENPQPAALEDSNA